MYTPPALGGSNGATSLALTWRQTLSDASELVRVHVCEPPGGRGIGPAPPLGYQHYKNMRHAWHPPTKCPEYPEVAEADGRAIKTQTLLPTASESQSRRGREGEERGEREREINDSEEIKAAR